MDDENSSLVGKNGVNDNPTNNQPTDKPGNDTGNNLPAPDGNNITKTGLVYFFQDLFIAGVPAIFFWILAEQFIDHKTAVSVLRYFAAATLTAAVPLNALRHWPHPRKIWTIFALFCVCLAGVFVASSRPLVVEMKSYPRLKFAAFADEPSSEVKLTNDFLAITNFGNINRFPVGILVIPIQSNQPNVSLIFSVVSSEFIDKTRFIISVSKVWGCVPDSGWQGFVSANTYWISNSSGRWTNELQSWAYDSPEMFPGDTIRLPRILIPKIPTAILSVLAQGVVSIIAKPKNLPVQAIAFQTAFVMIPTTNFNHKLIVTAEESSNGSSMYKAFVPFATTNEPIK